MRVAATAVFRADADWKIESASVWVRAVEVEGIVVSAATAAVLRAEAV